MPNNNIYPSGRKLEVRYVFLQTVPLIRDQSSFASPVQLLEKPVEFGPVLWVPYFTPNTAKLAGCIIMVAIFVVNTMAHRIAITPLLDYYNGLFKTLTMCRSVYLKLHRSILPQAVQPGQVCRAGCPSGRWLERLVSFGCRLNCPAYVVNIAHRFGLSRSFFDYFSAPPDLRLGRKVGL